MSNDVKKRLRYVEDKIYSMTKKERNDLGLGLTNNDNIVTMFQGVDDPTYISKKDNVTPEKLLNRGLCRSRVDTSSQGKMYCSRPVYILGAPDASGVFCVFHAFCSAFEADDVTFKRRCSHLRDHHEVIPKNIEYMDNEYSPFCKRHKLRDNRTLEEKCSNLYKNYKTVCLHDIYGALKTPATEQSCIMEKKCFEYRQASKDTCFPFTEDNGHFRRRSLSISYLDKCNKEVPKSIDWKMNLSADKVPTFKQPWVIDEYNRLFNEYKPLPITGGGRRKTIRRKKTTRRKTTRRRSTRRRSTRRKTTRSKRFMY